MPTENPASGDATISWDEARAANQALWDERAPQHRAAYGADAFAQDPTQNWVQEDLAALDPFLPGESVRDLDLIHLQCHIGTDTISLARAGARVTGLDFSEQSLDVARDLAATAGVDARWVQADVMDARSAVDQDFDVVFTGIGALTWLDDLNRWASQVAALLRPGGTFYIRDGHPMLYALDETALPLTLRYRYFADGTAQVWDDEGSYVPGVTTRSTRSYEWPHSLSEIIGSLLTAGLRLELFTENQTLPWQWAPFMRATDGGYEMPEPWRDHVPLTYTLIARKPG